MPHTTPPSTHALHVYDADLFWVIAGANQGDGLGPADHCQPGDLYRLDPEARPMRLRIDTEHETQRIAEGSEIGEIGDAIDLVARHVMMAPDGDTVDILLIRDVRSDTLYALPLSPVAARTDYTLLEAHDDPGEARLSDLVCVAFTTGTMITLAGGLQRPIEALRPGDRILTRDSGPQPLQLVARARMRALGSFAPVVISAGTLGNDGDLVVSPHHRIFLYRRGAARIGPAPEILVQARHLVDGKLIWRREGGYVDYYALVFEQHEIVYAEGIPCESLMVTESTLSLLPGALRAEIDARLPGLRHSPHFTKEAGRDALDRLGRDTIFRSRYPG